MAKILIIDDDPDIVDAQKLILEANGYEVISAADGKEGLEKARSEKPDLIILDVMMTTVDEGFHVAYQVQGDEILRKIPILMVTSVGQQTGFHFDPEKDEDFLPVAGFLEKPIKAEVLIRKVKEILGES